MTPSKKVQAKPGTADKAAAKPKAVSTALSKSELARHIAAKMNSSLTQAEQFITAYIETVTETLASGTGVALIAFGTFEVRQRAARTGFNPKTRAEIKIPASQVVGFKVGSHLKRAVAGMAVK